MGQRLLAEIVLYIYIYIRFTFNLTRPYITILMQFAIAEWLHVVADGFVLRCWMVISDNGTHRGHCIYLDLWLVPQEI